MKAVAILVTAAATVAQDAIVAVITVVNAVNQKRLRFKWSLLIQHSLHSCFSSYDNTFPYLSVETLQHCLI